MGSESLRPQPGRESWTELGGTAIQVEGIIKTGMDTSLESLRERDEKSLDDGLTFLNDALEWGGYLPKRTGKRITPSFRVEAAQAHRLAQLALNGLKIKHENYEDFESYITGLKEVVENTKQGSEIEEDQKKQAVRFFRQVWLTSGGAFPKATLC